MGSHSRGQYDGGSSPGLSGLMQDVDSYIFELSSNQSQNGVVASAPSSHSSYPQQQQHRPYNSYIPSSQRPQNMAYNQYENNSHLSPYNRNSGGSYEDQGVPTGYPSYSSQSSYQTNTQPSQHSSGYYANANNNYGQQYYGEGGYSNQGYPNTSNAMYPPSTDSNDVYPSYPRYSLSDVQSEGSLQMPVPSDYSYQYRAPSSGYPQGYPPTDYQSVRTPPGSPGQRVSGHNRPLSGQFYPSSPSKQQFQQADTAGYATDYSQASSGFERLSIDHRPLPPTLPTHESLPPTPATTLTSSGSQRNHPLPEPPTVSNSLENKSLPYAPVPELPAKYNTEHKALPQPSSPFSLPEKDNHRNHRAAPPSPIVTSARPTPEPPVRTYHLSKDDESPPDSPIFQQVARVSALAMQGSNYAFLSILSRAFVVKIRALEHVRELFCAFEYPESFTGKEAVNTLKALLPEHFTNAQCLKVAKALMHTKPQLFVPIPYSEKSLLKNTVYDSPDEIYTFDEDVGDEEYPHGVYTPLTPCYVRGCVRADGGCYAPRCPNRPPRRDVPVVMNVGELQETLEAADVSEHRVSVHSQNSFEAADIIEEEDTPHSIRAWAANVPKELLESTSKEEIARQEAIYEFVYSEEDYNKDLNVLHEFFAEPLRSSSIIEPHRRDVFIKEVFSNYHELRQISADVYKDLRERQRKYDKEKVPEIGDLFLRHLPNFSEPYKKYGPHFMLAEYAVQSETKKNIAFANFVKEAETRDPERTRRLEFRHFLIYPITRMQRYPLLLDAILKKTPEDHPDHANLKTCIEIIRGIASEVDKLTAASKQKLRILQVNDCISFKQGEIVDLQLTDPQRQLFYEGELKRRSTSGLEMSEKQDLHVFLFDHVLLMTKARKSNTDEEYRVWRRPIPLQMLFVHNNSDFGLVSRGSNNSYTPLTGGGSTLLGTGSSSNNAITIHHLGQRGNMYHLYANTATEKQQWKDKIDEAKEALRKKQGDREVFELRTLSDATFPSTTSSSIAGMGKINCSTPFMGGDGYKRVAVGTDAGVWFGLEGDTNTFRRVLSSQSVTQLAVLEENNILLVLAEKSLTAYPVHHLTSPVNSKAPDRLAQSIAQHVAYFQTGVCNGKNLVVYMKRKNTNSVFTALEPSCGDLRDPKNAKMLSSRPGFLNRGGSTWFKHYKDFYIGADSSNVHFLKSKINVVCEKGFEIIDPENLNISRNLPDLLDPQFNFVQRLGDSLKPLAMYRIHDKFLMCYNKFAFYVDNHGALVPRGPSRTPLLCEWEGTPDSVVYFHPYIIAVEPQFIEVRNVDNGELVQIVPGEHVRLTHYGATNTYPVIHGCMNHSFRPEYQHLFQLVNHMQRTSSQNNYASMRR
ncbi:RHO1 GDP-GTP exchange protein 2 [Umbelopsis nana]